MAKINRINYSITKNNLNIYTKRTCSDNSEMYITSKLNMLYEEALSKRNLYANRRNLRKLVEENHIDRDM